VRYCHIAGILGQQQYLLLDEHAVTDRWSPTKHAVDVSSGVGCAHGDVDPRLAHDNASVDELIRIVCAGYREPWCTSTTGTMESFLRSSDAGPA